MSELMTMRRISLALALAAAAATVAVLLMLSSGPARATPTDAAATPAVPVAMPDPSSTVQQAFAVFRRAAVATDTAPTVGTTMATRRILDSGQTGAANVYLVDRNAEDTCVYADVPSAGMGAAACTPKALQATDAPAVQLVNAAQGVTTVYGAAPDGVVSVTLATDEGGQVRAVVAGNGFTAAFDGHLKQLTYLWADGHTTTPPTS
jgi:hypothetical protein